jgi:hypothetical protein
MYDLTLGQNGHFNKKTNQKNYVSSCPMPLVKINIFFYQCGHFNQIEPFEKP